MLRALLQGQLISALIAGTGIFASILSDRGANFPMLLSFLNYVLLSMFIWRRRIVQNLCEYQSIKLDNSEGEPEDLAGGKISGIDANNFADQQREPTMKCTIGISRKLLGCYLGAAFIDVEANFLIILAYNYTSITSIMLLDCFTIPCAMGLSYIFLGCRYNFYHFYGVSLCILGLICIVISDISSAETEYGSAPLYGDILCLIGSGLYAASNVSQEYLVKYHDRDEYLGFVGGCGAVISAIQLLSLNYNQLRKTKFTSKVMLSISGFVSCLFFMYVNTSAFLQNSDSTLFNLSLLTSDVYAVLFSYFFYGYLVNWLYFLSFALVASGLWIYHSAEAPSQRRNIFFTDISNENNSDNGNHHHRSQMDCSILSTSDLYDRDVHILTVLPSSLSSISLTKTLVNSVHKISDNPDNLNPICGSKVSVENREKLYGFDSHSEDTAESKDPRCMATLFTIKY